MCMGENKMDKRKEKSIGEVLSEHEKEVIKVYRQLSEDNKLTIDILIMRLNTINYNWENKFILLVSQLLLDWRK